MISKYLADSNNTTVSFLEQMMTELQIDIPDDNTEVESTTITAMVDGMSE